MSRRLTASALVLATSLATTPAQANQNSFVPPALRASRHSEAEFNAAVQAGLRYKSQWENAQTLANRHRVRADNAERVVRSVVALVFKDRPGAPLSDLLPELEQRLAEQDRVAENFAALEASTPAAALPPQSEGIRTALDEGRLGDARALINASQSEPDQNATVRRALLEISAGLALVEGRGVAASQDYLRAADLTPLSDIEERSRLENMGRVVGFQAGLAEKTPSELTEFVAFSSTLAARLAARNPTEGKQLDLLRRALWATANAYDRLAEMTAIGHSEKAVAAYRQLQRLPGVSRREWAVMELAIGRVLQLQAGRDGTETSIIQAAAAYQRAGESLTADQDPTYHFSAQHGLAAMIVQRGAFATDRDTRGANYRNAIDLASRTLAEAGALVDPRAIVDMKDLRAGAQVSLAEVGDRSQLAAANRHWRQRLETLDPVADLRDWFNVSVKTAETERVAGTLDPSMLAQAARRLEQVAATANIDAVGAFSWGWLHYELGRTYWAQARRTRAPGDYDKTIAALTEAIRAYDMTGSALASPSLRRAIEELRQEKRTGRPAR